MAGCFSARSISSFSDLWKRVLLSAQHYALPFFSWFLLINCMLLGRFDRNPLTAFVTLMTHVDGGLWFLWVVFMLSLVTTLCNWTLNAESGRIVKTGIVLVISFGILLGLGIIFGLNFIGVKYILYYAVFYGFGWLAHKTEEWWKQWWPKTSNVVVAVALVVFLSIVYSFDLYHAPDNLAGITFRCVAGFTGNLVLLWVCCRYEDALSKIRVDRLGKYTLEVYATHMYVNNLMTAGNQNGFFTVPGFGNFLISLLMTVMFTVIIIAVFKCVPAFDFVFYGKRKR